MKKRQNDQISNFSYYICTTEIVGYKEKINASTLDILKVSKGAKIRNRYNQVPHLTLDT